MRNLVKKDKYLYEIDMGDGTVYLQRRFPVLASEGPISQQEEVIIRFCEALTHNTEDNTMSTTVIEALENAKANFETSKMMPAIFPLAMEQLENAIEALENGLSADDIIQEHILGEVNTGA